MLKSEYLACMKLHSILKEKINGNIFISINDNDTLYIHVRSYRGLSFKFEYKNISCEILGKDFININKIINIFMNEYAKCIRRIFFKMGGRLWKLLIKLYDLIYIVIVVNIRM